MSAIEQNGERREPLVTVLMPVHNGGVYVAQAVNSILAQTFRDFEFVIVDDASTDSTPEYLATLCDARIRILHLDHGRPAVSRGPDPHLDRARGGGGYGAGEIYVVQIIPRSHGRVIEL